MVLNVSGDPVDARTMAMLDEAEARCGFTLTIVQGKNPGGVAASAGTHDGWGVVDIRLRDFTDSQRRAVVLNCRTVGFAAWLRTPDQGFDSYHCHAIAIGDSGIAPGALRQVDDYKRGLNGLASHGRDDGPSGFYGQTWDTYLQSRGGITVSAEANIIARIDRLEASLFAGPRYQALQDSLNAVSGAVKAILPALRSEDVADDAAVEKLNKSLADLTALVKAKP